MRVKNNISDHHINSFRNETSITHPAIILLIIINSSSVESFKQNQNYLVLKHNVAYQLMLNQVCQPLATGLDVYSWQHYGDRLMLQYARFNIVD